jgi:hypothetical protein
MSVAAETSACALCGGSIGVGDKECPNCHATAQWQDYARAVDFARKSFAEWVKRGIIREGNQKAIDQVLLARRQTIAAAVKEGRLFPTDTGLASPTACWRCGRPVAGFYSYCNTCWSSVGKGSGYAAVSRLCLKRNCPCDGAATDADAGARLHRRCSGASSRLARGTGAGGGSMRINWLRNDFRACAI